MSSIRILGIDPGSQVTGLGIIDVENNYKDDSIKRFLASKGYHLIKRLMCDEIYQKKCD